MTALSDLVERALDPSPKAQRYLTIVAGLVLIALFVFGVFIRENDYVVHLAFGEAFLRGDTESLPGNMYPLPRTVLDAVLSIPGYYLTRAVVFIGSVAALAYSVRIWQRLAAVDYPLGQPRAFAVVALSLLAASPFLVRDFDEAGLHLYLLLMLSLGAWAWQAGARITSGFWLALAACYKATPLLFLPFLIWKREWLSAASMAGWLVVLNLAPALWLGWDGMIEGHLNLLERLEIASNHEEAYPSLGPIEAPKQQNLGLRALIARYVESHPDGHPLHLDHPLFFQFGDLDPATAKIAVWAAIFLIGAYVAFRFRHRWDPSRRGADMAPEWAVIMLACVLLSPLTWKQHLVVALPCIFLAVRSTIATLPPPRARALVFTVVLAMLLVLRRYLFGAELSLVFHSYKFDTIALIIVGLLVMHAPQGRGRGDPDGPTAAAS